MYLETWLWSPLICAERSPSRGSGYMEEAAFQGFFLITVIHCRYTWCIPVGVAFLVKLQAVCLAFWWKGAPLWVFLECFTLFIFYYVNGCFLGGTALGACFNILSTLFILIFHGRKVFWQALFAGWYLVNVWYWISHLLSVNSALVI